MGRVLLFCCRRTGDLSGQATATVRGVRAAGLRGALGESPLNRTEKPPGTVRGVRAGARPERPPGHGAGCEGCWREGSPRSRAFPGNPALHACALPASLPRRRRLRGEGAGRGGAARPEGRLWWRGAPHPTLRPGHVVPALQLGADPVSAGAGAGELVSAAEGCGGGPRAATAQRASRRQRRRCPGLLWGGAGGWDGAVLLAVGAACCPWG